MSWPVNDIEEGSSMKAKLILVLAFILASPLLYRVSLDARTGPSSFVCMAQCGGHSDPTAGCETPTPPPPTNTSMRVQSPDRPSNIQSGPVRGDSGDLGSGLVTGLMALGVGLLFWLRMR